MDEHATPRILLVDDEPNGYGILSRLLTAAGFETQQAEDGIDSLAKLKETLPDLIICDLNMPRMSGGEFISVVRRRLPHIPVIVISGGPQLEPLPRHSQPDVWVREGSLGAEELLQSVVGLINKSPDEMLVPEVTQTPVRARHDGVGDFVIPCSDCLRPLNISDMLEIRAGKQTVTCIHCQACVRFFVDDSEPS